MSKIVPKTRLLPHGIISVILFLAMGVSVFGQQTAWTIDSNWYYSPSRQWTSLESYTLLYYDQEAQYSLEEIVEKSSIFSPAGKAGIPTLWNGQIWGKLTVRNTLETPAFWTFLMHVDEGEIHIPRAGNSWQTSRIGSNRPRSEWDATQHSPAFLSPYIAQVEIPAGAEYEIYIRLSNRSLHRWFELKAMSRPNFLQESIVMFVDNNWAQGLFHGMCWMMIFFSMGIFMLKKDRTYLYLALYILSVSVFLFFQMEMDKPFWIAEYPRLIRVFGNASFGGIITFYPLLIIHFLHQDNWRPDIKKLILQYGRVAIAGGALSTLLLAIAPLDLYSLTTNFWLLFPLPLIGLIGLLYICYIYLRSDNILARFFAITNLCLFFGSITYYYWSYSGLLDYRDSETYLWPVWIMEAGFVLQMIALVLSIGYRDLQVEREKIRLTEVDHLKSRFFANISHEFRTPLTLILGPIQEMKSKTGDPWWQDQLKLMQRNAHRLLRLINQILDLAKLDSGKAQLERSTLELVSFTKALTFSFQSLAEQKGIDLQVDSELQNLLLSLDKEKIEQVLLNLLSNALKFTPAHGAINVKISETPETVSISITNTGTGIAKDHLPHLFERFYQADTPGYATDQPSTGIGLALTREWVLLHEGEITVESEPNHFTRFQISLPRNGSNKAADGPLKLEAIVPQELPALELPDEEPADLNGTSNDAKQPALLIVEDNPDIRKYIRQALQDTYQITEAFDGAAGLDLATGNIPDLILTDVMMPKMDGFELSRRLKQQEATSHIPIIILTGKASRDSKLEGLATQADDFLAKPFDAEELRLRIRNLLHNRSLWRKRYHQPGLLDLGPVDLPSREQAFLQQAKNIIEEYLGDESFSVEQLSSALALDRTQLFRKLRALTGQNPSRFIRSIRLKRARQLLEARVGTAAEIGFMVGFSSPSYFSKCFKEEFGMTPGEVM